MAPKLQLAYVKSYASLCNVEKNVVVIRTLHIYIDITMNLNLDISYETDHIIYVVGSNRFTKGANIMVKAHFQSSHSSGEVCWNIVPNPFKCL